MNKSREEPITPEIIATLPIELVDEELKELGLNPHQALPEKIRYMIRNLQASVSECGKTSIYQSQRSAEGNDAAIRGLNYTSPQRTKEKIEKVSESLKWIQALAMTLAVAIASSLVYFSLTLEATAEPPLAAFQGTTISQQSVDSSLEYLRSVMDEYHNRFHVYDDVSSAGNHFHAFAKIPNDTPALGVNGSSANNPQSGATAIRFELRNTPETNFAGFYLLNGILPPGETKPQLNFGSIPNAGIDLSGATALIFWARGERGGEKVDFFMGGVGWNPDTGMKEQLFADSTPTVKTSETLSSEWRQFRIDLTSKNLSYVLGGFGWVASVRGNPDTSRNNPDGVVFYVDDIQYELSPSRLEQRLNEPRFIRSFTTLSVQPDPFDADTDDDIDLALRNTAFTYDNALAALAFLADGGTDSLRRAKLIGDAFVYASQHDRSFNDNRTCNDSRPIDPVSPNGARLRSAYAAGDIALPPGWIPNGRVGTVPAPGFYYEATQTFFEVEQGAIDVGNNSWAMITLLALYQRTQISTYLDTACKLGNLIRAFRNNVGQFRGFQGGINDPESPTPTRRPWASSEHNLDVYAAFTVMSQITNDPQWQADAEHARQFIEAMWDAQRGCYLAGTLDPENRNALPNQLPLDVQAWSVLVLPNVLMLHPKLLDCAEANHRASHHGFSGFDFNEDKDGVWFEGTGHMTSAYAFAGDPSKPESLREELRRVQQSASLGDGRGTVAACHDGVSTGFGFKLFRRLHVGATAWNVFAQLAFNPYYQTKAVRITEVMRKGKKLIVKGENFQVGAVIEMNGQREKTTNDEQNPTMILIGKKAGKKIAPGETVTITVLNSDGTRSAPFRVARPA